jgi:hypothetical protein
MNGYTEILSQENLNALLSSIRGFHDSIAKEAHLINRAFVSADGGMDMTHAFDLQLLIQSQWPPYAMELVFAGVRSMTLDDPREYWGASGSVTEAATGTAPRVIRLAFDKTFQVVAEQLFWRPRPEWTGPSARLRGEVPAPAAVIATPVDSSWRQCSACAEAWQAATEELYSRCPSCKRVTILNGAVEQRDEPDKASR